MWIGSTAGINGRAYVPILPARVLRLVGRHRSQADSRDSNQVRRGLEPGNHVVPLSDPSHGNTSTRNTRPAASNLRTTGDQTADLGDGFHRSWFKLIWLVHAAS